MLLDSDTFVISCNLTEYNEYNIMIYFCDKALRLVNMNVNYINNLIDQGPIKNGIGSIRMHLKVIVPLAGFW